MSSFDELRDLINGRTGKVITGTVSGIEGDEVSVRTANGIVQCVKLVGHYRTGSQVRIQGNIILGSVAAKLGSKVYRV